MNLDPKLLLLAAFVALAAGAEDEEHQPTVTSLTVPDRRLGIAEPARRQTRHWRRRNARWAAVERLLLADSEDPQRPAHFVRDEEER